MESFSLLEAVEVAVNMEEEGIRFYALAEERAGDPESKKLFAFLREKEHQHVDAFRRLYQEIAAREGGADADLWLLDPEVASYFRAVVDSAVFPAKGSAERVLGGLRTPADVLRFGLRIERESVHFYHELLAHCPWPAAKELVGEVIAEERRHFRFIHERLLALGG